jgi:hypothetical protein
MSSPSVAYRHAGTSHAGHSASGNSSLFGPKPVPCQLKSTPRHRGKIGICRSRSERSATSACRRPAIRIGGPSGGYRPTWLPPNVERIIGAGPIISVQAMVHGDRLYATRGSWSPCSDGVFEAGAGVMNTDSGMPRQAATGIVARGTASTRFDATSVPLMPAAAPGFESERANRFVRRLRNDRRPDDGHLASSTGVSPVLGRRR